jgi:hypothetical protein
MVARDARPPGLSRVMGTSIGGHTRFSFGFGEVPRGTARVSLVPWPVEIGDEVTVEAHPWPVEVVDLVWAPAGAKVAALVKVRPAVLHPA